MTDSLKRRVQQFAPLHLEVESGDGFFTVDAKVAINFNVLSDAQEKCGHNFLNGGLAWVNEAAKIRALLWAALLPYQPEFKDEELTVGEYLTLDNQVTVVEALLKAYGYFVRKDKRQGFNDSARDIIEYMRTGKEPEKKEAATPLAPTEAKNLTGSISGPLQTTTSDSAQNNSAA